MPGPSLSLVTKTLSTQVGVTEALLEQVEHPQTTFSEGKLYHLFDS